MTSSRSLDYPDPIHLSYVSIGHFTVVYLVPWSLTRTGGKGDLVLLQTLPFFTCNKWSCWRACQHGNNMFNIWKASLNLLSCRRHIGKREDPGDEVVSTHEQLEWGIPWWYFFSLITTTTTTKQTKTTQDKHQANSYIPSLKGLSSLPWSAFFIFPGKL